MSESTMSKSNSALKESATLTLCIVNETTLQCNYSYYDGIQLRHLRSLFCNSHFSIINHSVRQSKGDEPVKRLK